MAAVGSAADASTPMAMPLAQAAWRKLNQPQDVHWKETLRTCLLRWVYLASGQKRQARRLEQERERRRRRRGLHWAVDDVSPCCLALPCLQRADRLRPLTNAPSTPRAARLPAHDVTRECLRSLGGFLFGLLFTSLFGLFVLFIQEYNLWYCLVVTITVGVMLGLGMGLSAKIRVNVFLMFPHIFSRQGKGFLMVLAFGLVVEGPLQNIVTNFTRGSDSIACGAELAMNQTRELMQKAKEPLISALEKIKAIAESAKGVGVRVHKFFLAMKDSIRHIVRILRNIYRWISQIGTLCNKELGEPYAKCIKVFDDAIFRCSSLLGILTFLCHIVNAVKPLCGVVTILQLFCLIPNYIKDQLNQRIVEPIADALDKLAQEFEFNLVIEHQFKIQANQSKTLSHLTLDIMDEIQRRIGGVYKSLGIFSYISTIMMLFLYIQALIYRKNYLFREDFDNYYITDQFVQLDMMRARNGKSTVLPLSYQEACRFVRPCSIYLTNSEKKRYIIGFARALQQAISILVIILLDYSIYWVVDMVSYHLKAEIIARCILYGMVFFIVLFGCYIARFRRYVCSVYYPSREQQRVSYLYNQIHSKRSSLAKALYRAVQKNSTDAGHTNILLVLAARWRVFAWIAALTGVSQDYCLACGRIAEGEDAHNFVPCITPGCKGFYCQDCYRHMNNICSVCMGPLAYQGDIDQEVDSSDSGKVRLWISALDTLKLRQEEDRRERRRLRGALKRRIRSALSAEHRLNPEKVARLQAVLGRMPKRQGPGDGGAPNGTRETGGRRGASGLDFSYQERSGQDSASDEPYDPREFVDKRRSRDVVSPSDLQGLERERVGDLSRAPIHNRTEPSQGESSVPATPSSEPGQGRTPILKRLLNLFPHGPRDPDEEREEGRSDNSPSLG
ncbi:DC-STAMP domain-containing protein 2 isoform X7 [Narcine bancroftii]|uniref:DC-STAMP domain-containing protein 2 isoform X7 n=1 Tax=Narcine bancroftii TaxID=1343680 RepID=UPI003831F124